MKRDFSDKNAALEKTIPNGTMILELLPSDTSGLDRGSYVYDVQITLENGDVFTFIEGDFILRGDVK